MNSRTGFMGLDATVVPVMGAHKATRTQRFNPQPRLYLSISLDNDILTPETALTASSLALMSAIEVAWKNADRRNTFNLTALDDYVWRRDDAYGT